jgi:hypothetical protein
MGSSSTARDLRAGILAVLAAASCCGRVALADEPSSSPDLVPAFIAGYGQAPGRPSLEIERQGATLVLRGVAGDSGTRVTARSVCLLCTSSEALAAARSLGAELATRAKGTASADGTAPEALSPAAAAGAEVAPAAVALDPALGAGVDARADAARLPAPDDGWRPSAAVLAAGLGVAAAAVGGVFLWLDGRCATSREDQAGNCENEHDLMPAGAALVGVGAAAIAGGLVILFTGEAPQAPSAGKEAR